jgi:hypothetical protein
MSVLLKLTRATVELQPSGKSSVLIASPRDQTVAVSLDVNRGLRGEPGTPAQETITAGEALGGHRVITAEGLHTTEETIDLAIGITAGAASIGTPADYIHNGVMDEPTWTWTPGGPIFVGNVGVLTQTEPIGTLRQIGTAVSATKIAVNLRPTIYRS